MATSGRCACTPLQCEALALASSGQKRFRVVADGCTALRETVCTELILWAVWPSPLGDQVRTSTQSHHLVRGSHPELGQHSGLNRANERAQAQCLDSLQFSFIHTHLLRGQGPGSQRQRNRRCCEQALRDVGNNDTVLTEQMKGHRPSVSTACNCPFIHAHLLRGQGLGSQRQRNRHCCGQALRDVGNDDTDSEENV